MPTYFKIRTQTLIPLVIIAINAIAILFFAGYTHADSSFCIVISSESGAWVTGEDKSIKSTLGIGDRLYEGETIEIQPNGSLDIAFDSKGKNMVHVNGGSSIRIVHIDPVEIQVNKGSIYAVLDDRERAREFKISSPSSISKVYGTRFRVDVMGAASQVSTFRGRVYVSGKDLNGKQSLDFVLLNPQEKTRVEKPGTGPGAIQPVTASELEEANTILGYVDRARARLEDRGYLRAILTQSKRKASQFIQETPDSNRDTDEIDQDIKGDVLFL